MARDSDYDHPLYMIAMLPPGQTKRRRDRHNASLRRVLNETKGDAHLMEEYVAPNGTRRTTLCKEARDWLIALEPEDEVSILAGMGLTWITIYSVRDAAMFKMFWL